MARLPQTTTIIDDDGGAHKYEIIPHGAQEGVDLLPRALNFVTSVGGIASPDAEAVKKGVMKGGAGLWALLMDLLKYTSRDGLPVTSQGDEAYQANYGELAQAATWALKVNYGKALAADGPFVRALASMGLKIAIPKLGGSPDSSASALLSGAQ